MMYSRVKTTLHRANKEEHTKEKARNTSNDTELRAADKVNKAGEFGHQ